MTGLKYRKVHDCEDQLLQTLIESHYSWAEYVEWTKASPNTGTSTMFDTVAVYLAISDGFMEFEQLGVIVTDDGYTLIDNNEKSIRWATKWKNLSEFEN